MTAHRKEAIQDRTHAFPDITDESEIRKAVANAIGFSTSLYRGPDHGYWKLPASTLASARYVAPLMVQAAKSPRKAMVYALGANGSSVFVPEEFQP